MEEKNVFVSDLFLVYIGNCIYDSNIEKCIEIWNNRKLFMVQFVEYIYDLKFKKA